MEFFSFDLKTEDPLRKAVELSPLGPVGFVASKLIDGNMTNDAVDAVKEAGQEAMDMADRASDWAANLMSVDDEEQS